MKGAGRKWNLVVRQDLSDAEKYRLAQADTLMRLVKADSIEELERMLPNASIQQLNQKMRDASRRLR